MATRQQFVLGRAAFLAAFNHRPVFPTDAMKTREATALVNIDAEIERLSMEAEQAHWPTS